MTGAREEFLESLATGEADVCFTRRVRTILEWLPPDRPGGEGRPFALLDAGCGRGFYLGFYLALGAAQSTPPRLFGIEHDIALLDVARGRLPKADVQLTCGDLHAIPFAPGSFDGIIASEVLEHVRDDGKALRELYRVLRPGGTLVITVPHAHYPFLWDPINFTLEHAGLSPIRRGPLAGIWALHERLYTREELRARVVAAGFTIEEERSFTHACFPFIHNLVYGLGKPLLESNLLPRGWSQSVDRHAGGTLAASARHSPLTQLVTVLRWFDRHNGPDEPAGRRTVNLAVKARKA